MVGASTSSFRDVAFGAPVLAQWHPAFNSEIGALCEDSGEANGSIGQRFCGRYSDVDVERRRLLSMSIGAPRTSVRALLEARVILTEFGFQHAKAARVGMMTGLLRCRR
jgi:hypothetical protein